MDQEQGQNEDTRIALRAESSVPERLEGLSSIGLSWSLIASALGVSLPTLTHYRTGERHPRGVTEETLDTIRLIALTLLDVMTAQQVRSWLDSQHAVSRFETRPVRLVRTAPEEVFAAVEARVLGDVSTATGFLVDAGQRAASRDDLDATVDREEVSAGA